MAVLGKTLRELDAYEGDVQDTFILASSDPDAPNPSKSYRVTVEQLRGALDPDKINTKSIREDDSNIYTYDPAGTISVSSNVGTVSPTDYSEIEPGDLIFVGSGPSYPDSRIGTIVSKTSPNKINIGSISDVAGPENFLIVKPRYFAGRLDPSLFSETPSNRILVGAQHTMLDGALAVNKLVSLDQVDKHQPSKSGLLLDSSGILELKTQSEIRLEANDDIEFQGSKLHLLGATGITLDSGSVSVVGGGITTQHLTSNGLITITSGGLDMHGLTAHMNQCDADVKVWTPEVETKKVVSGGNQNLTITTGTGNGAKLDITTAGMVGGHINLNTDTNGESINLTSTITRINGNATFTGTSLTVNSVGYFNSSLTVSEFTVGNANTATFTGNVDVAGDLTVTGANKSLHVEDGDVIASRDVHATGNISSSQIRSNTYTDAGAVTYVTLNQGRPSFPTLPWFSSAIYNSIVIGDDEPFWEYIPFTAGGSVSNIKVQREFTLSTTPYEATVLVAGVYNVSCYMVYDVNTWGTGGWIKLRVVAGANFFDQALPANTEGASLSLAQNMSNVVELIAGEKVYVQVKQYAGAPRLLQGSQRCKLDVRMISTEF